MRMKKFFCVLGSFFIFLILGETSFEGSNQASAAEKHIKIGLMQPQTGPFATLGGHVIDGFKLALEEAGYKVAGRSIELIVVDEGPGDPGIAMDKARKLVESDKIDIMVGPFNNDVRLPVLPYTSSRKIPNICSVAETPEAVKFPYVYAPIQSVYSQPRPLAWYAFDKLGVKTVNAIGSDWHAGRDFIAGFKYGFTKDRGGRVVQEQYPPIATPDYSSYLVAMKDADAVAVMMLPPDIAPFLAQAHAMGVMDKKKFLVMGGTVLPPMLKGLGPKIIGRAWSLPEYQPFYDSPANKKFVADFAKKTGHPPDTFTASGYTRVKILFAALEATKGDTDPDKLHEAIKGVNIDTPQGRISFTKGNPNKSGVQGICSRFIETIKKSDNNYMWNIIETYEDVQPINK